MPPSLPRRFYRIASACPDRGDIAIHLDARPVRTPGGRPLRVPTLALGEAIAAEWQAQGDTIAPATMPLTQLASTAIDRVAIERAAITAQLIAYAGTDLVCYRTANPADLASRQTGGWQPLLDWAADSLGARLEATDHLLAVEQPAESLSALRTHLDSRDCWQLTAIQAATAATGSLILALALAAARIDAETAWSLSQIEEGYQIELWGEDAEAAARRRALADDIAAAERLLALLAA